MPDTMRDTPGSNDASPRPNARLLSGAASVSFPAEEFSFPEFSVAVFSTVAVLSKIFFSVTVVLPTPMYPNDVHAANNVHVSPMPMWPRCPCGDGRPRPSMPSQARPAFLARIKTAFLTISMCINLYIRRHKYRQPSIYHALLSISSGGCSSALASPLPDTACASAASTGAAALSPATTAISVAPSPAPAAAAISRAAT